MTPVTIPAISLWNPYGFFIAVLEKEYETRSWPTRIRGDVLICAAKKQDAEARAALQLVEVASALRKHGKTWEELPFGMALCVAALTDCVPADSVPKARQCLGDFAPGRWAWRLTNVRLLVPYPVKGRQGFWQEPNPLISAPPVNVPPAQMRLFE